MNEAMITPLSLPKTIMALSKFHKQNGYLPSALKWIARKDVDADINWIAASGGDELAGRDYSKQCAY